MNEQDLARLAVAKRAYEAARPNDAEVQKGVRRARLGLRSRKPRRHWLSKGLVFVVLAMGSLAYAKPHALGAAIEQVLQQVSRGPAQGATRPTLPDSRAEQSAAAERSLPSGVRETSPAAVVPAAAAEAAAVVTNAKPVEAAAVVTNAKPAEAAAVVTNEPAAARSADTRPAKPARTADSPARGATGSFSSTATNTNGGEQAVSEWGRVGQALARGDARAALVSLNALAESDDPRTRDKADLGRAQLLLAHGKQERACALARSLTERHPGQHIERQARSLLTKCDR